MPGASHCLVLLVLLYLPASAYLPDRTVLGYDILINYATNVQQLPAGEGKELSCSKHMYLSLVCTVLLY